MNVLSIDLDFLMPMLSDLNLLEINKEEYTAEEYQSKIREIKKVDFKIDINAKFFLELILNLLETSDVPIYIIDEHQQILDIIKDQEVNLVNVDQHHDIYYSFLDKNSVYDEKNKKYLESCWVYYLYVKNQLKSYTWIANSNSKFTNDLLKFPFSFYIGEDLLGYDYYGYEPILEEKFARKYFDTIVFVKSPYYLPKTKEVIEVLEVIETIMKREKISIIKRIKKRYNN